MACIAKCAPPSFKGPRMAALPSIVCARRPQFGFTPLMLAIKSKNAELTDKILAVEGVKLDLQTRVSAEYKV